MTQDEQKVFERELALNQHNAQKAKSAAEAGGIVGQVGGVVNEGIHTAEETYKKASRLGAWAHAAYEATARKVAVVWRWLDPVAERALKAGLWAMPKLSRFVGNSLVTMSCKKGEDGHRHFDPWYFAKNVAKVGVVVTVMPLMGSAAYYYGTWATYENVYIPNAGVFVNQQFVHPSKAGQVIAPRDEVFTILGKEVDNKGNVAPVRFDLDSNMYFFFYKDALRPDLAASKMDSQSPYGVECTLEATGFYTRLPRYIRVWAMKWMDLRAEVVRVVECKELNQVPSVFYQQPEKQSLLIPSRQTGAVLAGNYYKHPTLSFNKATLVPLG